MDNKEERGETDVIVLSERDPSQHRNGTQEVSDREAQRKRKIQELENALEEIQGEKLLIVIKGPPDPDSIASAWAHKFIGQHYNIDSLVIYFDPISHQENRALVKSLGTELLLYNEDIDLSEYKYYALVDTPTEDFVAMDKMHPDRRLHSLVDHHKKTAKVKARFLDIRENAGATSSIYAEYLKYGQRTLEKGLAEDTYLATALLHGIRSDTDDFFLARQIDWTGAAYLSYYADRDLARIIASGSITANTMEILQRALASKEIKGSYLFAGVGFIREDDRDGISQAADYLLKREGIDTVVVFGVVEDKYIHGSLRTQSTTLDPDTFLKEVLGADKETGRHYGGGRSDKGGFQVPLSIFSGCPDRDLLWELVKKTIQERFYRKLGSL